MARIAVCVMTSRAVSLEVIGLEVIVTVEHAPADSFSRSVMPAAWRMITRNMHRLPAGTRALTRERLEDAGPGASRCVWTIGDTR